MNLNENNHNYLKINIVLGIIVFILSFCFNFLDYSIDLFSIKLINQSFFLLFLINTFYLAIKVDSLKNKEIETSYTDDISGALSRNRIILDLDREIKNAKRQKIPLSIIIFEVNNLIEINNLYGRDFGDKSLFAIGLCAKKAFRDTDFFGRLNGNQFCAILPNTEIDLGENAVSRLKKLINDIKISSANGEINIDGKIAIASLVNDCDSSELINIALLKLKSIKQ